MTNTVSDRKGDLKDVESALRDLEDGTGDVRKVFSALGSLRKSLKALQEALGGTVQDTSGKLDVYKRQRYCRRREGKAGR